jgi:type 1 glutamine amidotransferase/Ca2+-binding EF-hand superfamily protein
VQISFKTPWLIGGCASALAIALAMSPARQPENFFDVADANHDGFVTRDEFRAATTTWLQKGTGESDQSQLAAALDTAFPESVLTAMLRSPGPQNQTPKPADVEKMEAALPTTAPAKPAHPRKVLVLSKAAGYVHSCIPLAAKTVEDLGNKTGAWSTTVTYDSAAITADNLKQYDLVFLNNTTGQFLDDPDPAVTAARKKALLEFVRSGKGLAGIHAAGDSYHRAGANAPGMGPMLAPAVLKAADTNGDKKVNQDELNHFSDKLFDSIDQNKTGKLSDQDLRSHLLFAIFALGSNGGAPTMPAVGRQGPDPQVGTWPEFNKLIGGFFKYHWLDPQHIVYKIDDPNSPLTSMFHDGFSVDDETYTFSIRSWSRHNLHVLTSIDYSKMSDADKRKEDYPRPDHDYGLSWIRREGKGRVFYEAHGHDERIYAMTPMLEHLLAGIQYALGDLKANDAPSQ